MWDVLIVVLMLLVFFSTLWLVPGLTRLMGRWALPNKPAV